MHAGGAVKAQTNIHQRPPVKNRHRQQVSHQTRSGQADRAGDLQTEEQIKKRYQEVSGQENGQNKKPDAEGDSELCITWGNGGIRRGRRRSHKSKNNNPILTVSRFRVDNPGMEMTSNRRDGDRLLCAELIQLIWNDAAGRERRRVANLEDISLSGVCLQVESAIESGTAVAMQYGDGELLGTVRYCRFQDSGYFLGVELSEGSRWSSQHFKPKHLLDPKDLVDQVLARHSTETKPV
jgi:hypothetical protein